MKKPLFNILFLALVNSPHCFADTFVLTDGSSIEGKILSETAESYVLEVNVTKNIKDEKTVPKANVFKIVAESPDKAAFEKIEKLIAASDLWSAEQYKKAITEVEKFITDHKSGTKLTQAKNILDKLKAEAEEISKGGIKYHGKVIAAAEYEANAYELDAEILAHQIQVSLKAGQVVPALRAFSKLDAEYAGTSSWRTLLPTIKQVMQEHGAQAQQLLDTFENRAKEREMNLQQMTPSNRSVTKDAIAEEEAVFRMNFAKEKEAGVIWPILSPSVKESLQGTVSTSQSEIARLSEPLSFAGDSGKVYRETLALLKKSDYSVVAEARKAISETQIPERYIMKLRAVMPKPPTPEN
ncbi:MAG: hypothetical protein HC845_07020 [Akkermansiaceae bacterium]|nr:hypothetical protein [Akkermansiaceae bacterium]